MKASRVLVGEGRVGLTVSGLGPLRVMILLSIQPGTQPEGQRSGGFPADLSGSSRSASVDFLITVSGLEPSTDGQ